MAASRVNNDRDLRIINFKKSQLKKPVEEVLTLCEDNRGTIKDLSCCRNQSFNELFFRVNDVGLDKGTEPEGLCLDGFTDGSASSFFESSDDLEKPMELGEILLMLGDNEHELSSPPEDMDIEKIM